MTIFSEGGFLLEYSSSTFDPQEYSKDFKRMLEFMRSLEQGEFVNTTEKRQVGHYWLRNPDLAPNSEIRSEILSELESLKKITEQIKHDYTYMFYAGIGGSGLGPNLIYDCFSHRSPEKKVIVLDNIDPEGLARKTSNVPLSDTIAAIVSKSGTTTETNLVKEYLKHSYAMFNLPFPGIAITMQNTPLWNEANDWLGRFKIWEWVGGRTSIFGAVGLVVFGFLGLNIDKFLEGGRFMDELTRNDDIGKNPASILAFQLIDSFKNGKKNLCVVPYSDRLEMFTKYLQQLFMESLGKKREDGERFGVTVYGNKGTTDQHSFFQQLREGIDDFTLILIRRLHPEIAIHDSFIDGGLDRYLDAFLLGSREAIKSENRSCLTITIPQIDEFWFGALIALFERVVGYFAAYFGINAYDQPGVEAGKKAAKNFLESGQDLKKIH